MLLLALVSLLGLGAELTGLCHSRGIPTLEAMVHQVEMPPSKGYYYFYFYSSNQKASPGDLHYSRRMQDQEQDDDDDDDEVSASKRVVPQGPNPLHN
ncbi:hypothetical protein ABZP36_006743 [Zizania latifolia]